jgi:hypothetical protein
MSFMPLVRPLLSTSLIVLSGALAGCGAGSAGAHIGTSDDLPTETNSELEPSESRATDKPAEAEVKEGERTEEKEAEEEEEGEVAEPREAHLARAVLHELTGETNHLGLAFAISERTSDLHWVLAIENRSPQAVQLAALPELLRFSVSKVAPTEGQQNASKPVQCGSEKLPTKLAEDDFIEVGPGELIFHAFDPRPLCKDDSILEQGATVEATYGFPIKMQKRWQGGKLVEVETKQVAPYVGSRAPVAGEEVVPLKILTSPPFVLGRTYPLAKVSPFVSSPTSAQDSGDESKSAPPPPPPLTLVISPLGTSSAPENKEVSLKIVNTSGKSMKLFVRRELISYEVNGPLYSFTCRMHPSDRYPLASEFLTLSNGGSTSLVTRLAEACPATAFSEPGTYAVFGRMDAQVSGEEQGVDAFIGTGFSEKPAHLVVPDQSIGPSPRMHLAPSKPVR